MEKNMVLLRLEDYNELREFKEKIESGKKVKIRYYGLGGYSEFLSPDEALKEVVELNEQLNILMKERDCEIKELKFFKNPAPKTAAEKEQLETVKNMSVRQFRKWRKK